MSWIEDILARKAPRSEKRKDVAGYVVKELGSGRLVYHRVEEVGHLSDDAVADRLVRGRERLEKKYDPSNYEVEAGLFNSLRSFHHFFPETKEDGASGG